MSKLKLLDRKPGYQVLRQTGSFFLFERRNHEFVGISLIRAFLFTERFYTVTEVNALYAELKPIAACVANNTPRKDGWGLVSDNKGSLVFSRTILFSFPQRNEIGNKNR